MSADIPTAKDTANKLVDRATSKLLDDVDWPINLEIASACSTNAELAEAVVAALRKRLSRATRPLGLGGGSERHYLLCLALLNCLMKHAWLALHFVHSSDVLAVLQKLATSGGRRSTPAVRDKTIRLLRLWAQVLGESEQFPKFWLTNQHVLASVGQQVYDALPNSVDATPPELLETFAVPPTPQQAADGSYVVPSSALRPPPCLSVAVPEVVATRSYRVAARLPHIRTRVQLCQDFLDIMDAPDLDSNDTLAELYPECQRYHAELLEWIADGQIADAVTDQLIALNDQMLEINQAYNTLASGGAIYHEQQQQQQPPAAAVDDLSAAHLAAPSGHYHHDHHHDHDDDDSVSQSADTRRLLPYRSTQFRDEDDESQSVSEVSFDTAHLLQHR